MQIREISDLERALDRASETAIRTEDESARALGPTLMPTGWRLANLLDEQLDGVACCHCRTIVGTMVAVGTVGSRTLYACWPPCQPAREAGRL